MWSYSGSCDVMLVRNTWLIIKHSWQVKSTLWEVSGGRDFRWGGQDFIWLYWPQFFDVEQDVNPAEYLSQSCHWVPDHELLSNICQLTLVSSQHFRGEGGKKKKEKRWYILKKENNEGQTSERSTYWLCLDSQFRPDHTRQTDLCHQTFEWWLVSTSLFFFFRPIGFALLCYRISVIELKLLHIANQYRLFQL